MGNESGVWIMYGLSKDDPNCIHTAKELSAYIEKVGFLPLFKNDIPGFSVEEHTESAYWWSGDALRDPWEWRKTIAAEGNIAYGKFFDKKAAFISKEWLPHFINYRRDGYDFDALWDDEKASLRQKKIMDNFDNDSEIFSNKLKELSGFGKDGEKNFDGVLTALQMEMYLCVRDFKQRLNKRGEPYGWPVAVYSKPEHIWGNDYVASEYIETPEKSKERIIEHIKKLYHGITEKQLSKI